MRLSRKPWLKAICAVVAAVAVPASAQLFAPLALAADDEQASRSEKGDYWIGVRCAELPALLRAQLDLPEDQGVLVDEVVADGPAQKAGLKAYDVVFAVDGKTIGDPQALATAVERAQDREVKLDYLRAGRKQSVSIKPGPRPESLGPQQQDQRFIRQWVEKLGRGAAPMNFRVVHPGMVFPPGVSIAPALPNDMTVTIEKRGDKPASVWAKQGDKSWEASEESLDKLPPEARQFAEHMLGLDAYQLGPWTARLAEMPRTPEMPTFPREPRTPNRREADAQLNQRLDDMNRQIDELRKSIEKLQSDK